MLVLSRKQNQEIVFPHLGVRIEVARIRGNTVCLGIEAPKEIAILRGELENLARFPAPSEMPLTLSHELRNHLNAMSLCLHAMMEKQEANLPIDGMILARALQELHTIEEITSCDLAPTLFVDRLEKQESSPLSCL